jgi:RNA polymerase sigma factor (sigma-70 family)
MARYTLFTPELLKYITQVVTRRNSWASSMHIDNAVAEALFRFHFQVTEASGDLDTSVGWLLNVAGNHLRDEYRRTRKFVDLSVDGESSQSSPQNNNCTDTEAEGANIRTMLSTHLNNRMAETIWMHDLEDWKPAEIAEQQGRSVNAVHHDIKRGHAKLRKVLKDEHTQVTPPRK